MDEKNVVVEEWSFDDEVKEVPFFNVYGHKVWGATAVVLAEFVAILERLE
jgi:hypothetical protein